MWEPRDLPSLRDDARGFASIEAGGKETEQATHEETDLEGQRSSMPAELLILNKFGIGYPYLAAAWRLSQKHGIDGREVLFRAGLISEDIWLASQKLLENERARAHLAHRRQSHLLDQAVHNLWRNLPHYSAAQTWTLPQLIVINLLLIGTLWMVLAGYELAIYGGFLLLSAFYTASILLRAGILAWFDKRLQRPAVSEALIKSSVTERLPIYSVVVPLLREGNQVKDLVGHLSKLNWPKNQLDIKLICERDDPNTLQAISGLMLPDFFELVVVPACKPQTKPKALNYALPLCTGEYLVIYDAEDRPNLNQLQEAYHTFQVSDPELACLQAPLAIHNGKQNWLTAMFAIEYNTLFTGILPVLAYWRVPLPLGGTSNHFKVRILKAVGGWDPFNVTEDADLGIRLFREGYTTSTITLPTYEEAPPTLWPWIAQRTRWIKGWMQTILVHNRNPVHLLSDLGLRNTLAFHLLLTTIVVSALVHPVFLAATLIQVFHVFSVGREPSTDPFILVSIFNLVAGYTTYGLLAFVALKASRMRAFTRMLIFLPFYWILISLAGWRALFHLVWKPHRWEKTPHGLANTKPPSSDEMQRKTGPFQ